jgi:hypothetical protein
MLALKKSRYFPAICFDDVEQKHAFTGENLLSTSGLGLHPNNQLRLIQSAMNSREAIQKSSNYDCFSLPITSGYDSNKGVVKFTEHRRLRKSKKNLDSAVGSWDEFLGLAGVYRNQLFFDLSWLK